MQRNTGTARHAEIMRGPGYRRAPLLATGVVVACVGAVLWASYAAAQEESRLPDVVVEAKRTHAAVGRLAGYGLTSRLGVMPELAVVAQGVGAQSDLRIRGSSFSESGLSIAGLGLQNPQTEHFNLELPLPAHLFTPPELLTGLDQVRNGTGHYAGTLAAEFAPIEAGGSAELGLGEQGTNWQSLSLSHPVSTDIGELGATLFGTRHSRAGLDYGTNDADWWNGGLHVQRRTEEQQQDLALSQQRKHFGARGFYGSNPAFPSAEDLEDQLMLFSHRQTQGGGDGYVRCTGVLRVTRDHYVFDRDRPALYENWHRSTVAAVALDGATTLQESTTVRWRAEATEERLASTRFGDFGRRRASVTLLPEHSIGPFLLTVGGRTEAFSSDRPAFLGIAGLQLGIGERHTVRLDYTEGVRQPSFTDLYYVSITNVGDPNLERQRGRQLELSWHADVSPTLTCKAAVFGRHDRHTVDWVKPDTPADRWQATDLGTVRTAGLDLQSTWDVSPRAAVELGCRILGKSHHASPHAGRYVLDYPRQSAVAALVALPLPNCELRIYQALRHYTQNRVRTTDTTSAHAGVSVRITLPGSGQSELIAACENLWNDHFEVVPGQESIGRQFYAALRHVW